ncbi:MAG: hypothetical protein IID41_10325 [Planctomycetes bacterium]|nr:hypothetical protein [Planctomycetota bacterium]
MAREGERIRRIEDVLDEAARTALILAIFRNMLRGDYKRGNFRLESDHPDIDGTEFEIPPEVAAA